MEVPEKLEFLSKFIKKAYSLKPNRVVLEFDRENVRELFKLLLENLGETGFYLAVIEGTDFPDKNMFRLDYYVITHPDREVYVFRTWLPRDNPHIDTVVDFIPAAYSGECETYDLLGIVFDGNKYLKRGFFVPKDVYEKGVYPLRKEFKLRKGV